MEEFENAIGGGGPRPREKPFDFDEWCREIDQHPAFLTELKPQGPNHEFSAEVQAIQALKFDEEDPVECATAYKEEGNRHFAKKNNRWAVDAYTKGIRCYCVDKDLNSILYSNRAAANRHLGNLRSAFRDCFFARRFNKDNYKAIQRGAECLLELGKASKCIEWIEESCQNGIHLDEQKKEKINELRKKAEQKRVFEERDARKQRAKMDSFRRDQQKLLDGLKERKIKHKPPITSVDDLIKLEVQICQLNQRTLVHFDTTGQNLVWPLLLQYPETGQTDFVNECLELTSIKEILDQVLQSPADWDVGHTFRVENIRIFIELDGHSDSEMIREIQPMHHSLKDVLNWPEVYITRGLPTIQVYTREYIQAKLRLVDDGVGTFQFIKP